MKRRNKECDLTKLEIQEIGRKKIPIRNKPNCVTEENDQIEIKQFSKERVNESLEDNNGIVMKDLCNDSRFKGLKEEVRQLKEELRKFLKDFKSGMKTE